jgi:hypothetical protein
MALFQAALVGGQMLDAASTIFIVSMGGSEGNPLMSALLGGGYVAFVLRKLALAMAVGMGAYYVSRRGSGCFLLTVALTLVAAFGGAFSNVIAIGAHFF